MFVITEYKKNIYDILLEHVTGDMLLMKKLKSRNDNTSVLGVYFWEDRMPTILWNQSTD